MFVTEAVVDAVRLIETRGNDIHILGVAAVVAPENGVGDVVGELYEA